jgi:NAD(P)-dependent dehydrogenase (short-subunit alcohol dehydrogenase family)
MGALDGKIAIVTGGTSGIGEGIAKAFVSEGAKVVIVGRSEQEGRALEKRLGVRFVRADVANEADVKAMIDRTLEWFGRLDCLVNNAGIPSPRISITETDAETIDQVLAVNVRGVILGTKHAALAMLKTGSGSIINIGSVADTAAASRLTCIRPRKGPSAPFPAPLRRSWAKREFASTPSRPERS